MSFPKTKVAALFCLLLNVMVAQQASALSPAGVTALTSVNQKHQHLDAATSLMMMKPTRDIHRFRGGGGGFRSANKNNIFTSKKGSSSSLFADDGGVTTDGKGPSMGASSVAIPQKLDVIALVKWTVAYVGQVSLLYGALCGVDQAMAKFASLKQLPFWSKVVFFYVFQQCTTFFSLLPRKKTKQQRQADDDWEYNKRVQPSWTPPGWVFGLMWPLFVFGTRAVTSAMVVTSLETTAAGAASKHVFSSVPIMVLMAHLCIANVWNCINNVERRLGPCVPTLWLLAFTKAAAAYAFYQVNPLAGKLLALTLTWLTAAAALETDTWRINPDLYTGMKEKLYPVKAEKWVTKFRWES